MDESIEFVAGNVFIRQMGGAKGLMPGEKIEAHLHNFDHVTILFAGCWSVKKWYPGQPDQLEHAFLREGPFFLLIEKDALHEIEYLGPEAHGIGWCLYSHRTPQGEVSVEYNGWRPAYEMAESR